MPSRPRVPTGATPTTARPARGTLRQALAAALAAPESVQVLGDHGFKLTTENDGSSIGFLVVMQVPFSSNGGVAPGGFSAPNEYWQWVAGQDWPQGVFEARVLASDPGWTEVLTWTDLQGKVHLVRLPQPGDGPALKMVTGSWTSDAWTPLAGGAPASAWAVYTVVNGVETLAAFLVRTNTPVPDLLWYKAIGWPSDTIPVPAAGFLRFRWVTANIGALSAEMADVEG